MLSPIPDSLLTVTWLFDLGNTRCKWAVLDAHGRIVHTGALPHVDGGFDAALLAALAALPRAGRAWLASVASADLTARVTAIAGRYGVPCERVRTQRECAGVRIAYAQPERLGVDRFLALLGAHARGPGPWLVASAGTALTVDALAPDGRHLGGLIAPSPALMRAALAARAPQLDVPEGRAVDFADNTEDALSGGILGAAAALIERSHARASAALGAAPNLLLTGGGVSELRPLLSLAHEEASELVLEGLAVYAASAGR